VTIQRFNASDLPEPQGYTHVSVAGPGRIVHLAGQAGTDAAGQLASGLASQTEFAVRNLLTALRSAGGGPEHLVKLTFLVVNWESSMQRALGAGLAAVQERVPLLPTTLIGVGSLYLDGMLIEVDGVAVLSGTA
jgi:enamine deaminase RidA (YjgF/YER057c/UK114 family)